MTRAAEQAPELALLLQARGAIPVPVPVMRLRRLLAGTEIEALGRRILAGEWQDLVFTSANAVGLALPVAPEPCPAVRVFAIGPGTAAAVSARGWPPEPLPQTFIAESLAARVLTQGIDGHRVLLPRARGARPVLPQLLRRAGARLDLIEIYEMEPEWESQAALATALSAGDLDGLIFTSGSSVDCFQSLRGEAELPRSALIACIGPVTADAARRAGLAPDLVASEHSMAGLLTALESRLGPKPENDPRP
ncbi:MAG: uroporphyrinogen-III synthase [Candidatus Dormibacteria bacterium]